LAEGSGWLAIDKPHGLLAVPGRYGQDHVIARLQSQLGTQLLYPVHRLDQDTSGILLIAKSLESYRQLAGDFAAGRVTKIYQGVMNGVVDQDHGEIDLPLAADVAHRPRQRVDYQQGKPSRTRFRLIEMVNQRSRLAFQPLTGRTHQIRVHGAMGLGMALVGDRLYGAPDSSERLHLHAHRLIFQDPQSKTETQLESAVPF
jgi:tRNA pseudouridine32 synthase / 23S rRNA pseudouridine746 synthase